MSQRKRCITLDDLTARTADQISPEWPVKFGDEGY